jgi:hypothetical protein
MMNHHTMTTNGESWRRQEVIKIFMPGERRDMGGHGWAATAMPAGKVAVTYRQGK